MFTMAFDAYTELNLELASFSARVFSEGRMERSRAAMLLLDSVIVMDVTSKSFELACTMAELDSDLVMVICWMSMDCSELRLNSAPLEYEEVIVTPRMLTV